MRQQVPAQSGGYPKRTFLLWVQLDTRFTALVCCRTPNVASSTKSRLAKSLRHGPAPQPGFGFGSWSRSCWSFLFGSTHL